MRRSVLRGAIWVGMLTVYASGAELALVPLGPTAIGPSQTIGLDVTVNGIPAPTGLRSYQTTIEIVPQSGATGTLTLADLTTPGPNSAIFVDQTRPDWVYAGLSAFAFVNVDDLRVAGTVLSPTSAPSVTTAKYVGSYVLRATADAAGDFLVKFKLIDPTNPDATPTNLLDVNSAQIPFTSVDLAVTVANIVSNDDCASALSILDGLTPFTTINATTDGPALAAACDEGNGLSFEQDVWFDYTATCNGVLTVSTCDDADFDTRLAVYGDGSASAVCPIDNTFLLACDDDGATCGAGTSELSLNVTAGRGYTIRVGGFGAAEGTGRLSLFCAPDLCANAKPVAVPSTTRGSTKNTTVNDGIGPNCGAGAVDSPGVWYSVTGTGGLMSASLCSGTSYDSRVTVYSGSCGSLSCVADADDTCGQQEAASWCSTLGAQYLILVHGAGGASGSYTLSVASQTCDDGNACTTDTCNTGVCTFQDNYNASTECCRPSDRAITLIDDQNPCTVDSCNALTGSVSHTAGPDGVNVDCDDGFICTLDECFSGACRSIDINTISCINDVDCPGTNNSCVNNHCECVGPTLLLVAEPSPLVNEGCYIPGETIDVRVDLGPPNVDFITPVGQEIVAVQFFVEYDPTTLTFVRADPGAILGTGSPFSFELDENVDVGLGQIDYLVTVGLGGSGTRTPTTAAVLQFQAIAECDSYVQFRPFGTNGAPNRIALSGGEEIQPNLQDLTGLKLDGGVPALNNCPTDVLVGADMGELTAVVSWANPTAADTCEPSPVFVGCEPPSGSVFDPGTTTVTCSATDSCGLQSTCSFDVTVQPSVLTVDLELSPTMASGPVDRCITFDLWGCSATGGPTRATVSQVVSFSSGQALGVNVDIPGGLWECLTARDGLHTLRSTAPDLFTDNGVDYTATFVGPRTTGGHWLVGGNLNGDNFIDILDFAVFFPVYLSAANTSLTCESPGPDANINGDGVIDLLDLVFVSGNSLQISEPNCCGSGGVASADGPVMSISVEELRARGLGHLAEADINRDGWVDSADVAALVAGDLPDDVDPRTLRGQNKDLRRATPHGWPRR